MKLFNFLGASALAFALAVPAFAPASAAGYHDRNQLRHGGISYVGRYGLKYAPRHWHRHHGTNVSVKIYFGEQPRREDKLRTRPLIIDLPR
jgi:hypothetical protein